MDISIIQYLFESSIALLSFYLLYYWGLRQETFFQLNRWYLLLMPAVALSIPLLNVEVQNTIGEASFPIFRPIAEEYYSFEQTVWAGKEGLGEAYWHFSVADLLYWFYWLGFTIMSVKLLRGLHSLANQIQKARAQKEGKVTYLRTNETWPAASFFSYIFWNHKPQEEKYQLILQHEMVHVRQRHSLDVLLMELWVIIKWFNPIVYLYRKHLRLTHEYIADQYVVEQTGNRLAYAQLMVDTESEKTTNRLTHKFNSLTKMRLIMLAKSKSSHWRYTKYALALPIGLTLFALFSFNLVATLPDEVRQPFEKVEQVLGDFGEKELVQLPQERPVVKLKWGEKICDCKPEKYKNVFRCENLSFSPRSYKRFVRKWENFQLFEEAKDLEVKDLRIISNRMVDMGGFLGQFDESGAIRKESPLWQKPKVGDVYKFEFKGGAEKWFSFEVVINNRKEELEPTYIVDLGSYSFSVDMTSKIGVRHFNFVDFQRAIMKPFLLLGGDGEPLSIKKMDVRNASAYRQETREELGTSPIDLSKMTVLQDVIAGDQIAMTLWTEDDQKIRIDLMLRKNASSQIFRRDAKLRWGDKDFPLEPFTNLILKKKDLKNYSAKPMSLVINDEAFPIVSAEVSRHERTADGSTISHMKHVDLSPAELEKHILSLAEGALLFARMNAAGDRQFYFSINIEQEVNWEKILKDNAEYKIQGGTGVVHIRNITQEGLEAISQVRFHIKAPGFTIADKEGSSLPLYDLPKQVTFDQVDYIKVIPPSALNQNERSGLYLGKAIVFLK